MATKEKKTKEKKPPKFHRDLAAYTENHGGKLVPGRDSPICLKCQLDAEGARNPYIKPDGPVRPLITIVTEGISKGEDEADRPGVDGTAGLLAGLIKKLAAEVGLNPDDVRWTPLTRCCARTKLPNYKTKGNWCRWHLVEDLMENRPQLIMPIGTTALGALCHKSSAQDWGGRLLTYRGWPDDWLVDRFKDGHPLFPKPGPNDRIPMFPVQAPRLIYMTQNPRVIKRWRDQVKEGLRLAVTGVTPNVYERPWWKLVTDPDLVQAELDAVPPDVDLHFDTETNGLYAFREGAAIVLFMFRWEQDGQTRAIGFPWDYEGSPLRPHIPRLTPCVLNLLYRSRVHGHNLGFDVLFTHGTLAGCDLTRLTNAMTADLWHMLYTLKQEKGSLGLELVAYDWAPSLAGYEEEMVLLIERMEQLQPDKGGHYANCPPELWDSHLKPYIMGDVEVLAEAVPRVRERLENARRYRIPLAHTETRGKFRHYEPPGRDWVYDNMMSKSARTLARLMGRGMHIDTTELERQEDMFPKAVAELRTKLKNVDPRIVEWHDQMVQTKAEEKWAFDLEKPEQLKTVLFDLLKLPIKRLTKAGIRKFGENPEGLSYEQMREFAAADKFTLNLLAAENPNVRPLIDYRKTYKAYTAFVRPMRNAFAVGIDKRDRTKEQHLMRDQCVHASFNQCGTRGGRLSCNNPNLQQLPRDSAIKRMYQSRFGAAGCIYQGDLSQIELRLLAAACGDPNMVKAYWDRVDIHSLTTSLIFKVPYENFSKDYAKWLQTSGRDKEAKDLDLKRKIGKTVNFLTGYGGGPLGLQNSLATNAVYLPFEECESIVEGFFDNYPCLRRHISLYKDFIMQHGVAVSIFGRVRIFQEVFGEDKAASAKALRSGYNHLIQSTASDLMLMCLSVIEHLMREANLESILVSTVHDSFVADCRINELDQVHGICRAVIKNIPEVLRLVFGADYDDSWIIVPLDGDFEVGPNYLDQRRVVDDPPDWEKLLAPKDEAA